MQLDKERQGRMSGKVIMDKDRLVFELHGIDRILAVKRTISVPLKHVVSVSTERVDWNLFKHLRVAGTAIPGVVKDGRFLTSEGLVFFEMHDPDKCITVSLSDEVYKKIVFEVEDKDSAAKMIEDAIKKQAKD